jgi:hypothetical protein
MQVYFSGPKYGERNIKMDFLEIGCEHMGWI